MPRIPQEGKIGGQDPIRLVEDHVTPTGHLANTRRLLELITDRLGHPPGRLHVIDHLIPVTENSEEVRIMTNNLRGTPEKHPERLGEDPVDLSALIQHDQARRLKGALIPDMPARTLPEVDPMLIGAILPLTAETNRFAFNNRQLKQLPTGILSHNRSTNPPLDHVQPGTRPRQQLGGGRRFYHHVITRQKPER
ncbi:hypothetical protein BJQ90_01106 [Arthrobacter sp. SO3]|nr:hypothetical protein [Arthrobacter sp. SO3]